MLKASFLSVATVAVALSPLSAQQTFRRTADFSGNGNGDHGKCTIEVVVDGAVEVEIRGNNAVLRNLSGQLPQWRRFVCTGAVPTNPVDFHFAGVDGRGKQQLIRDPRNGGVAVVRIEDPASGSEGYTFDLTWNNQGYQNNNGYQNDTGYRNDGYQTDRPAYSAGQDPRYSAGQERNRGYNQSGSPDRIIQVCEDAIRQQAAHMFRTQSIQFHQTALDQSPGRRGWINGILEIRREDGRGGDQTFPFSCSMNFETGQLRSTKIFTNGPVNGNPAYDNQTYADSNGAGVNQAINTCERAFTERIRRDGYLDAEFGRVNLDDRAGRSGWILGRARVNGQDGSRDFEFSCSINPYTGSVRSLDITQR